MYDDNGIFETSERIGYTTSTVAGSGTPGVLGSSASFPIVLACNPPLGDHRLRVRCIFGTAGVDITPCDDAFYGEIEDYMITISAADPCPAPTLFAATGVTHNNASFTWNVGCAETSWDLQYGPTGFSPGSGTTVTVTGTPGYSLTAGDLTPETTYDAYLQGDCDANGTSTVVGPITFTTAPAPPANDLCADAQLITCGDSPVSGT
ncbi:MAG: GEVED domain-containing protein [Flavobacteriales bacterium]